MQEDNKALKWGDIVRIHGVNLSKKKTTKGLIISKGFTDANLYYQTYNDFEDVNFYRKSLFQILPRVNLDMHDQLLDDNTSEQKKQALKSRVGSEIEMLEDALKSKAGKEIKYGSEIIFRHIESKSYIYGMLQAANSGEGAFKIEVSQNLSSFAVFKLVSPRSFQNENDKVYFNDALKIYHPSSDSYMNFSQKQEPIYLDLPEQMLELHQIQECKEVISKRPQIKKPKDKRTFIMNENKAKCLWKFIEHCSYEQYNNKQKIKSHDLVYFQHTRKGQESLVSTEISNPLNCFLKQNAEGNLSYECIWELIPKKVNELGPQDCNIFMARNIITGQLLEYDGFNVEIATSGKSEGKGFDNRGLINLICSQSDDPATAWKLEMGKQFVVSELKLRKIEEYYQEKSRKFYFEKVRILPKDIFMIFKVDQEILVDAMYVISAQESLIKFVEKLTIGLNNLNKYKDKQKFTKLFEKFKQDELQNIVKIEKMLIGKIYSTDFDNIVVSGNTPNQTVQQILVQSGLITIVIEILHNLYDPFMFIEKNNQPSDDRAIRLKITQIFEATYLLLEKVAANCQQNRIYISRWIDMFLKHSNTVNKSYIQQCLVGILRDNPLAIRATINEQKIKQLIDNFFRQAEEDQSGPLTTKYLRLFSTFIVCEGTVIKQNQNIILQNFFKNQNNKFNFRFKVQERFNQVFDQDNDPYKVKSKEVFIALKNDFMTIPQFFDANNNKWNYFLAYVSLLADICKHRNSNSIENVSLILPLQAVAAILFDEEISKLNYTIQDLNREYCIKNNTPEKLFPTQNIHEPFIRIAHHVYVDNLKFQEIKRIKRISQWYNSEQQQNQEGVEEINRTNRVFEGQKQQQEYRYLQSILEYIKTYVKNCSQDVSNLNMLRIVLSLLQCTVILGLWRSIKFFRELAPELMLKISKIQNHFFFERGSKPKSASELVEYNKQKLKMNRPQITLGIQCRILAIEIFKNMNELEIDIRLRYIMNFFKGLYLSTENFNVYDMLYDEETKANANEQEIDRNQVARQQYLKMEGKALFGDSVKKMSEDVDIILKENVWLNKLKQLTPFKYQKTEDPMKDRYMFQGQCIDPEKQGFQEEIKNQFNTIVLALFELSVYEDYKLLNSSLNMLRIMFQQRKDLLANFKKMLICGKGNLYEVYVTLKFMREKFNMLSNNNIKHYQGDADKSFPYELKKPYDYLIKDRQKRSGIIQDLFFLTRTLKEGTSLKNIESLMLVDEEIFQPGTIYNFINEKQKNNPLFQSLNLAEGIYKPLFQYIKIIDGKQKIQSNHRKLLLSIYQYLTLLCFNNLEAKQILMPYIQFVLPHLKEKVGAASFLYQVTRNNKLLVSNEQLVSLIIEKALNSCVELETSFALCNYILKQNIFFMAPTSNKPPILNGDVNSNDYQRSRILFALRGILLFNDQGHKRNQQLLMNRLQDSKYNRLIFQGSIQSISNLNDFNLSPSETFIVYEFQLFSVLVESGNMINIGKLENLHPYQYCLECLEGTNRWEIRRALRAYINRLYYVNKDKDIFLFEKFISREFTILNRELGDLVELHRKKCLSEDLKIKNGIRFSFAQSQIFLYIIECLITLHEMFLKPGFIAILRREMAKYEKTNAADKPIHDSFIKLFKNLGCINKVYEQVKTIGPFIKQVKNLMTKQLMRMQVRYLEGKSEPQDNQSKTETDQIIGTTSNIYTPAQSDKKGYMYDHSKSFFRNLSIMLKSLRKKQHMDKLKEEHTKNKKEVNVPEHKLKQRYLEAIFAVKSEKLRPYYFKKAEKKTMQYDPHLQTASSRIFKVLAKPELPEDEQNIELNNNLSEVKTMIEDSPVFDKFKDDEFIFFVNTTLAIDQTSTTQYTSNWNQLSQQPKPVIPITEVFKNIFKLIIKNPDKIDDQQKIFVIKMVRCFITEAVEANQSYKLSVEKWDAEYCQANEALSQRQQLIESCGGSDFIISIFKQNLAGRIQLLNEALLLGIAYLFGGNHHCQDSILNSLKKDPQNVMLINIKNLIKVIGDFLMNVRKIKENEKKRNFAYNVVDTYDYFNPDDKMICKYFSQSRIDKFEVQTELDNQKAIGRMFRFLQLFCQNNNKEMKKFLSMQINEGGQAKANNINFIVQACILLKKLFKIMNSKLVMIPNHILAFIGEITQVPIFENQVSFIKSTFFEDISYMASFFDSPQNKLQRKFNLVAQDEDDQINALSEIYRQGIKLALGNFQGNEQIIIQEFLNKCHSKLLWLIIRDELWSLIKQKYKNKKFYVYDESSDEQSRRKTFSRLDEHSIQQILIQEKKQKNFEGPIASIIQVLIILKKTDDFAAVKQKSALADRENPNLEDASMAKKARDFKQDMIEIAKKQQKYEHMRKMLTIFNDLILMIEINCQNGNQQKLQYIYFPNHPVFEYLASTTKDKIMVEVERVTPRDKLISLLEFREEVYDEITWNYRMNFYKLETFLGFKVGQSLPITSNLCEKFRKYSSVMSYVIIFLMFQLMIAEHEVVDEPTTYFAYEGRKSRLFLSFLCVIQLFLMTMHSVLWYILRGELALKKYLKKLESQKQQNGEAEEGNLSTMVDNLIAYLEPKQVQQQQYEKFNLSTKIIYYSGKYSANAIKLLKRGFVFLYSFSFIAKIVDLFVRLYNWAYNEIYLRACAVLNESEFKSILFFLITSILGNVSGVEWYTTHLFDFFVGFPELINVFKAIVQNISILFTLSMLATIFVVVFNILSLSTYVPVIYEEDLPAESCQSIKDCVLEVYTSGAIGDDMDSFESKRFFFDLVYVVFIELLFQNLVGGIVIDAYTSLTATDKEREDDKKNICYICSKPKSNMQKEGETFKKHTQKKHFLWNYLYYIYCLENKDPTDYTGIEYIIKTKIDEDDVSWFPAEEQKDMGGQIQELMLKLESSIDQMRSNQKKLLEKMDKSMDESTKALTLINNNRLKIQDVAMVIIE